MITFSELAVAVILGVVCGLMLASLPFIKQLKKDSEILRRLRAGEITMNEAIEMRKNS